MKALALVALGVLGAAAPASAYPINQDLNGRFICVQNCRDGIGAPITITQNGDTLNIVTASGATAQAWGDWNAPNRIWTEPWHQSAVYSPGGMTIQFDDGTVWQRPPLAPAGYIVRPVVPVR